MSNMNQSCCAIRNSRTRWLRSCSRGDCSCDGCEIRPGRNITARSEKGRLGEAKISEMGILRTSCCHQVQITLSCKHGQQVEDIEKKILIRLGQFPYQKFACRNGFVLVKWASSFRWQVSQENSSILWHLLTKGITELLFRQTSSVDISTA